jgi:hypothetical protein
MGEMGNANKILLVDLEGGDLLGNLGIDGSITLI